MRIGVFGGSFDPPHIGHLLAAQDAYDHLGLDRMVFVPAGNQPLKAGQASASAAQRLALVRLMVADDPRFEVSSLEVDRAGLSFTVDTLRHFAAERPGADLFLLLGADALALFSQWREPEEVVRLARLAILERAGEHGATLPAGVGTARVQRLATRRVDVSSTEIRERVRQGKSILGFVTHAVGAAIARDGLYR